ncbi:hypothetical protein [Streptomyces sp. Root369]|nr:hypothetical protein [Streptomyces sp. Root369]
MKHNPRRCSLCGNLPHGPVRAAVRNALTRQTRTNGENTGGRA